MMTKYDAKEAWTKDILNMQMVFPAEYVIRIFKGVYPRLNLDKKTFIGKNMLDIGCGDGRNFMVLSQCGFKCHGIELTPGIVAKVEQNMSKYGINAEIKHGSNNHIPYGDAYFDYLLSWNSCYYMGDVKDIKEYVDEYARVCKSGGYLVMSIPKKDCFIYHGSQEITKGYHLIKNDPFNIRNGEILRCFESEKDIEQTFSSYFRDFIFGSDHDDCFGYDYQWHLVVCRRK